MKRGAVTLDFPDPFSERDLLASFAAAGAAAVNLEMISERTTGNRIADVKFTIVNGKKTEQEKSSEHIRRRNAPALRKFTDARHQRGLRARPS